VHRIGQRHPAVFSRLGISLDIRAVLLRRPIMMVVVTPARNYVTDAASWVRDIAASPGNQMDVAMKDCLTRNCSAIDANVEALYRPVPTAHVVPQRVQQLVDGVPLGLMKVKVVRDVPFWYH
jgi:hypothetical protein